jgi:predicted nucleic acid-binding protein
MSIEKIYWDSDCFLGHLKADQEKASKSDGVIERAERGDVLIMTSALTLAEVLWLRGGPRLTSDKASLVQKFFRRSYIRVYNVTRKISESALSVAREDVRYS